MLFIFKSIYIHRGLYIVAVFQSLSHLQFFMTPFTVFCQDPLSMRISRQEYQSGLPFSYPDLPGSGIEPVSHALAGRFFTTEPPRKCSEVKVAQSCPTQSWDPMDYTVHGILQARMLEWVAFPFSRGSSQPRDWTQISHIADRFFTSWATREAHEYWSG